MKGSDKISNLNSTLKISYVGDMRSSGGGRLDYDRQHLAACSGEAVSAASVPNDRALQAPRGSGKAARSNCIMRAVDPAKRSTLRLAGEASD